jgi:hypothetical protein
MGIAAGGKRVAVGKREYSRTVDFVHCSGLSTSLLYLKRDSTGPSNSSMTPKVEM